MRKISLLPGRMSGLRLRLAAVKAVSGFQGSISLPEARDRQISADRTSVCGYSPIQCRSIKHAQSLLP